MKCPKCKVEFVTKYFDNMPFGYCTECKAVWVKFPLLSRIAKAIGIESEILNPAEMDSIKVKEDPRVCPDCGKPMDKVYFNGVVVDKCSDCNGILFDNGELVKFFNTYLKKPQPITENLIFISNAIKAAENSRKEFTMTEIEIQSKEQERRAISFNGFLMLGGLLILALVLFLLFLLGAYWISTPGIVLIVFLATGFKMLKPQEAMALTVFGKYIGTLKGAGFHWVNPFARSVTPFVPISLKARTLDNGKQKINDELGNPIEVGIIVIWEVQDTAKAVFNVDDYTQFLSSQSDSALRNIVRMYPYDAPEDSDRQSLRGDSQEISAKLKAEIQKNVKVAGLNIIDAKITHLAYAPEIAVAMLQRQQAAAIIDAKKTIVEGAVSMVEMALNKLSENDIVKLDEAEKAKMVNNLLVTLCSNKEAQPVIKNGLG